MLVEIGSKYFEYPKFFKILSKIQARIRGYLVRKRINYTPKARASNRNNYGKYQYATHSRIV